MSSNSYISPLMSRIKNQEKLTLEILAEQVPKVQQGNKASEQLKDAPPTERAQYTALKRAAYEGSQAKEYLTLIALPLIKTLAQSEFKRRQSWSSRVTLDDLISEGITGFLKGLNAYDPNGPHKSPTNYLGQWIVSAMKRNVEHQDHDFSVPYESIERWRKIRAIRSRLTSELGREPTDQEIVDEAALPQTYGDPMLGRVEKKEAVSASAARRKIQLKHIEEEREASSRTGVVYGEEYYTSNSEDMGHSAFDTQNAFNITKEETPTTNIEDIEQRNADEALSELIEKTLDRMRLASTQRDIICRKYGLSPYQEPQKLKDIAHDTSIPKHKITRITDLFQTEMHTPHGIFHELLATMDIDETESLNLGAIARAFGNFDISKRKVTHKDLINDLNPTQQYGLIPETRSSTGFVATFRCPKDQTIFTRHYQTESVAPSIVSCPYCSSSSPRIFQT